MSDPSVVSRPATQPANGMERRRAPRHSFTPPMPCQVVALAVGPLCPSVVHNASVGGLALLLPQPLECGTPLTVHLEAPVPHGIAPLEVRVVHSRPVVEGGWYVGCSLLSLPAPEFQALLSALQNANGSAAVALSQTPRVKGRSSVRLACNLVGVCRWNETDGPLSCSVRVRNLSQGGLSLYFDGHAPLAPFVTVDLASADRSFTCSLRARLLYKVDQAGGAIVGASFPDRLDPRTLRALLS